jgi:CBS domain-containing protein
MNGKDLIKTDRIIKVSPEDTIANAVSQLHSSHDVAFVFRGKHYMGVINPYYSLIKNNRSNGESLVKHFLYHPPVIHKDDSIEKIVGLMMDSRLHYLPVMDGEAFVGVVSARRVLDRMKSSDVFKKSVADVLKSKKKALVSVYEDDLVDKSVHLFEDMDISKLVVIDKNLKLKGIVSYHDLVPYLIAPKEKVMPNDSYGDLKIKTVQQTLVHTCLSENELVDCLKDIVAREIGSSVIVNKEGFPVGIITIRDLLKQLARTEEEFFIELSTNNISETNMKVLTDYGPHLERWVKKIKDLNRAMMLVKEEKNGGLFKVTFTIIPSKGKAQVYQEEGKNLLDVLKKINKSHSSKK